MIVVTKIETVDVDMDIFQLMPPQEMYLPINGGDSSPVSTSVIYESIRGIHYNLPDGRKLCIGLSNQAHEAIGVPLVCFNDQADEVQRLYRENTELYTDLEAAKNLLEGINNRNIWQRIKEVFNQSIN